MTVPPAWVMMPWTVDRPSPVPEVKFLGGEERLESAGGYLWAHAGPGVGDGELGVVPWVDAGADMTSTLVGEAAAGGGDGQGAAVRHGIAGVDGQVEQGLLDPPGVGVDVGGVGGQVQL